MTAITKTELEKQKIRAQIALLKSQKKKFDLEILDLEDINLQTNCSDEIARVYLFYTEVDRREVKRCIQTMSIWSRRNPGESMTVIFNSPGGSVIDGLHLFDFLQSLKQAGHHITTVGLGYAASMGGILLQAGHTRVMGENAYLLIHEITSIGMGKTSEMEDELNLVKRMQKRLLAILSERSTLTIKQIESKWQRRDWWLDSAEALELGFIDEIK